MSIISGSRLTDVVKTVALYPSDLSEDSKERQLTSVFLSWARLHPSKRTIDHNTIYRIYNDPNDRDLLDKKETVRRVYGIAKKWKEELVEQDNSFSNVEILDPITEWRKRTVDDAAKAILSVREGNCSGLGEIWKKESIEKVLVESLFHSEDEKKATNKLLELPKMGLSKKRKRATSVGFAEDKKG